MASGFVNGSNQDLDSVFAPWYTGWPQAGLTDFDVLGGADLNTKYATLATGSAAAATKFVLSSGADLNTIFAALGTTNVQVLTQPSAISGSTAAGSPSGTVTSNTTSCAGTKGKGSYTYTWYIANGSGFTLTTPNSQTCGITGDIPAGQSVSGGIYCTISDGTTSVNTQTVSASLTNTTPPTWVFGITAGQKVIGSQSWTGYATDPVTIGTGTNLTQSGRTIVSLFDTSETDGIQAAALKVSGFSADPGVDWFVSVSSNGTTHTPGESTLTYSYSAGVATWTWSIYGSTSVWFNFANGDTYSATISF